jgi:hypothetical protein
VIKRYGSEGRWDHPYTPNFAFDVEWCQYAAGISLDTKGTISEAMARAMGEVIAGALRDDGVAGHITGWCPEIEHLMMVWARETKHD